MFDEETALRAKGYTLHTGKECPLSISAQPGVVLQDGTIIRHGTEYARNIDWSQVRGWKVVRQYLRGWE